MSWSTELTERLRYYLNDYDATLYKWTDTQLQKFLLIAASELVMEVPRLDAGYAIDVGNLTITPDPVTSGHEAFSNLMVLKAACIIGRSDLKKAAASGGFKIVDDKSTIDTTNVIASYKAAATEFCEAYKSALNEFERSNQFTGGAVFGPYTEN